MNLRPPHVPSMWLCILISYTALPMSETNAEPTLYGAGAVMVPLIPTRVAVNEQQYFPMPFGDVAVNASPK